MYQIEEDLGIELNTLNFENLIQIGYILMEHKRKGSHKIKCLKHIILFLDLIAEEDSQEEKLKNALSEKFKEKIDEYNLYNP